MWTCLLLANGMACDAVGVFDIREWLMAVEGIWLIAKQKLFIFQGMYKILTVLQIFSIDFNKL
jgi:type IV secretory pathway TrbD component